MEVAVLPGMKPGHQMVFASRGNDGYTCDTSALRITLVLDESEQSNYTRDGNDLIYTHKLTLDESIKQAAFRIETLDGRFLNIATDQMPSPQLTHLVPGEGMPIQGTREKGDLKVRFDIQFPSKLAGDKKAALILSLIHI